MIRLFAGLSLPDRVKMQLSLLEGAIPGARWVAPESYHLTLRFIGDVDERTAEEVDLALSRVSGPAFELGVQGLGQFGDSEPRAVWAGVAPSAALTHLAGKIETAVRWAGLTPDSRRFTPHITLARLRNAPVARVMEFISTHSLFRAEPFLVSSFTLFSSHQGRGGAHYIAEAEYPLHSTPL